MALPRNVGQPGSDYLEYEIDDLTSSLCSLRIEGLCAYEAKPYGCGSATRTAK